MAACYRKNIARTSARMWQPETLADLAIKKLDVFVWCNRCSHHAVVSTALLIARLGPGCAVPAVSASMVCRSCGARDVATRPHWPDTMGHAVQH